MSVAIFTLTGCVSDVERVCSVWEVPRPSFCDWRSSTERVQETTSPAKRDPKTPSTHRRPLALIRKDLAASLFHGERHRKLWAFLRIQQAAGVGRGRVLRILRENHRLSRAGPGP